VTELDRPVPDHMAAAPDDTTVAYGHDRIGEHGLLGAHAGGQADAGTHHGPLPDLDVRLVVDDTLGEQKCTSTAERPEASRKVVIRPHDADLCRQIVDSPNRFSEGPAQ